MLTSHSGFTPTDDTATLNFCEGGDVDQTYGLEWESTAVGSSDSQACPTVNGLQTQGLAFRQCLEGNEWDSFINVSNCQTPEFGDLRNFAVS